MPQTYSDKTSYSKRFMSRTAHFKVRKVVCCHSNFKLKKMWKNKILTNKSAAAKFTKNMFPCLCNFFEWMIEKITRRFPRTPIKDTEPRRIIWGAIHSVWFWLTLPLTGMEVVKVNLVFPSVIMLYKRLNHNNFFSLFCYWKAVARFDAWGTNV